MELKDKASITLSIIALIISVAAAINTEISSKHEEQRTVRSQLTDVLSQIISVSIENAKLYKEAAKTDPVYYQAISSILNQRNTFLLQQAIYLTEKIPDLVTSVELNTIAAANANAYDLLTAEKYYLKAIDATKSDLWKAMAIRSYALFLFPQRRFEEARDQFRKSVSQLRGGDNFVRFTNGLTYQMWGAAELSSANSPERAEELFRNARNEFSGIDNEMVRNNAIAGLEATKNYGKIPPNLPTASPNLPTIPNLPMQQKH